MRMGVKTVTYQEPEFEVADDHLASIAYLEHAYDSRLVRWHCHEEYELHIIVATRGKVFIGDYVGDFSPGHIVLTGPNVPHNWISNQGYNPSNRTRDKVIKFKGDIFDSLYDAIPECRELSTLLHDSRFGLQFDPARKEQYESMFNAVRDSYGVERVVHFFDLMRLLLTDRRRQTLSGREFLASPPVACIDVINDAIDYIYTNFTGKLRLDDVASHVGASSACSFSKLFHKSTGVKYADFVKNVRISKACELLERSDEQITKICFDVGFANVANFNRHFLNLKGVTPREYRAECRAKFVAPVIGQYSS